MTMTPSRWTPFLTRLSRAVLASPDRDALRLPASALESGWLGRDPASEEQLAAAEARLGVTLPLSYRDFLRVSNGWRHCGGSLARLLPVEEIGWLRDREPELVALWQPVGRDAVDYRRLGDTLLVSDRLEAGADALALLNPARLDSAGEWQAWLFADWLPGAHPFRSFWALMQAEYRQLRQALRDQAARLHPHDPPETVAAKLPGLLAQIETQRDGIRGVAVRGSDLGYLEGTFDGLTDALGRLRALAGGAQPGDDLRGALAALADQLMQEASALEAAMRARHTPAQRLSALGNLSQMLAALGPMQESIRQGGRAQGWRQAAGLIRWFLGTA